MRIGIIGVRGIPVAYSAFETFAEFLSIELSKKGYDISVYCRDRYIPLGTENYKGTTIISLPSIERKNWETLSHSLLSTFHACLLRKYDSILYFGVGSAIFSILPRIFGIKTIVHIDGLDWKRKKWGFIGKTFLKFSEYLTTILPNKVLTDSQYMVKYYKETYGRQIRFIPYGFSPKNKNGYVKLLRKYNVSKGKYFAWVGRIVPENRLEEFIHAFGDIKNSKIKAVVMGDDLYESAYKKNIYKKMAKDSRFVRTGFIEQNKVLKILANSLAYVETKRSGGTHVSLIEAMGTGAIIISYNHPANHEVLGNAAIYYGRSKNGLNNAISKVLQNKIDHSKLRSEVKRRISQHYNWKQILKDYEDLFNSL